VRVLPLEQFPIKKYAFRKSGAEERREPKK